MADQYAAQLTAPQLRTKGKSPPSISSQPGFAPKPPAADWNRVSQPFATAVNLKSTKFWCGDCGGCLIVIGRRIKLCLCEELAVYRDKS